ncbi:MAG: 2-C-methyl-D-erythritol 2,4-cyclodiphosphate synthase [bacterium]|nr:2-C-methyl-D-erythritol 2,4-cyclodiphosphate synthase [bacterium]
MERFGLGFDSHKYKVGNGLKLGGVFIPCKYSFKAHSDGDIIIHALIDSILGALPDIFEYRNIGTIFPDSDPTYKEADSISLLNQILDKVHPWKIESCDIVLIIEEPKIGKNIIDIIENLKKILKTDIVNVKPKTAEGLGLIGNKKGAAAFCIIKLKYDSKK